MSKTKFKTSLFKAIFVVSMLIIYKTFFGILVIMVSQFIFNKNKFRNSCANMMSKSLNNIIKEIDDIIEGTFTPKDDILIYDTLRNLLLLINNKNSYGIFSKGINEHYFDIAVILERLADIIEKLSLIDNESIKINYLNDLKSILSNIVKYIENKDYKINYNFLLEKYINIESNYPIIQECNNLIDMLCINIEKADNPTNMIKLEYHYLS